MGEDGELAKKQYQKLFAQATKEQNALSNQMENQPVTQEKRPDYGLGEIKKGLCQMVDTGADNYHLFKNACQYRNANGQPTQFRKRNWNDLTVEVYL